MAAIETFQTALRANSNAAGCVHHGLVNRLSVIGMGKAVTRYETRMARGGTGHLSVWRSFTTSLLLPGCGFRAPFGPGIPPPWMPVSIRPV
jgi:hypothetical protein